MRFRVKDCKVKVVSDDVEYKVVSIGNKALSGNKKGNKVSTYKKYFKNNGNKTFKVKK